MRLGIAIVYQRSPKSIHPPGVICCPDPLQIKELSETLTGYPRLPATRLCFYVLWRCSFQNRQLDEGGAVPV